MAKRTGNKNGGMDWRGKEYNNAVLAVMSKRLDISSERAVTDIKRSFGGSGIPNATASERRANASQPGEIPHVQLNHLRSNIGWARVAMLVRRLGTGIGGTQSVPYAASLELGNNRGLEPRPFMRPGLKRNRRMFQSVFGKPVKLRPLF